MNRPKTKLPWCWGCLLGSREESAHPLLATKKAKSKPKLQLHTHSASPTFTLFRNFVKGLTLTSQKTETS
jgi:hypothetical protein